MISFPLFFPRHLLPNAFLVSPLFLLLPDRLKPYLLRREKDNVEKTVPPKEEVIVEVGYHLSRRLLL